MKARHVINTIDSHTGGEPTRLVISGIPLKGHSLLEQRYYMRDNLDHLRSALMCEPRGHRGMYGAVMAPATRPEADFGIIWIDHDGTYHNMCGHGAIGMGTIVVECGLVTVSEPVTHLRVDMPAGLVEIDVTVENGRATSAAFMNVPAFLYKPGLSVEVPEYGKVSVDIAFGGNFFGAVRSADIGIEVVPERTPELVMAGLAICEAIHQQVAVQHPTLPHIRSLDFVTIYGPGRAPGAKYKNIHVFSDGSFDRSPGGTGTSHMMAVLIGRGEMHPEETIVSEGITGSLFRGRMLRRVKVGEFDGFIPEITGSAFVTGFHQFLIDPEDPQRHGFRIG
jgi:proline racemase/trans-L-3-hydroxyproline dehydratase